jgi:XTP/dITP diphosphohydrolase
VPPPARIEVATSNPGKLREYRELAGGQPIQLESVAGIETVDPFDETANTFAENSAGKALYYSRFTQEPVIADDSGLVVPALGGAPGVHSARYAGPNASDADRVSKLLAEMRGKTGNERRARFVCILTLAQASRAIAVFSDTVEGVLADRPSGTDGFGYDPIFYFEKLGKTYAQISQQEKNEYSHRGRAFRKLLKFLLSPDPYI